MSMSVAPASATPTIDAAIDRALLDHRIVGAVILVARDGAIVYRRAVGLADRERTIPMREQVYCRAESGPDFDVQFPQVWIRVFAREHGIPYFDLWAPLREHALATSEQVYLADDIHLDERGHALAGELMRAWFQAEVRPLVATDGD